MAKQNTVPEQVKTGQVNSFTGGLNTDLHPLLQPADTLTDCVNGTLITYNGNENMLQNDIGNYALKGSELPDGFIPLGIKEHNGVVYIVSHNPITEEVQVGYYPSPEDIEIPPMDIDISSQQIEMSAPEKVGDYTYKSLSMASCLETQKIIPAPINFDVEVSLGDSYEITSEDDNVDFQHGQFYVVMEDGGTRNIDLITDGTLQTFNQKFSGKLCKKYELNKVTNFTHSVDFKAYTQQPTTRIVGGDENNATQSKFTWNYTNPDLSSVTIQNTLSFDRIDYCGENPEEVLIGVLYEVTLGDPVGAFVEYNGAITEISKSNMRTHWISNLQTFDPEVLTYDFEYVIDDKKLYFPRVWEYSVEEAVVNVQPIANSPVFPIEINAYPILIHRVDGKDCSVLCYDNSKRSEEISILDIKGSRKYQYYASTTSEQTTNIYLTLDDLVYENDSENFKQEITLNILEMQPDGSLFDAAVPELKFTWVESENMWVSRSFKCNSDFIFIRYSYLGVWYTLPLFLTINKDRYNSYVNVYNDFCLIPGDELFFGGSEIEFSYDEESIERKYVKVKGNKLYYLKNDFPESILYRDNKDVFYGDFECAPLTISNIQDGDIKLELQIEEDGEWKTIYTYKGEVINNKVTIPDVAKTAYLAKCIPGEEMPYIKRVYLAKHGHAPFAYKVADKNAWLNKINENVPENVKPFVEQIVSYGGWEDKKTVMLDKVCGKNDPSFALHYGDLYGEFDTPTSYIGTEDEWKDTINKIDQIFVPIEFSDGCDSGYFTRNNKLFQDNAKIYWFFTENEFSDGQYYISMLTSDIPAVLNDLRVYRICEDLKDQKGQDQTPGKNFTELEWLLFYLYTHAFYFEEITDSLTQFFAKDDKKSLRLYSKQENSISIGSHSFSHELKTMLLSNISGKCKNFDITNKSDIQIILPSADSYLWSNVESFIVGLRYDIELIKNYDSSEEYESWKNTLFCDTKHNNAWQVVMFTDKTNMYDLNTSTMLDMFNLQKKENKWINVAPSTENIFISQSCGKRSGKISIINLNSKLVGAVSGPIVAYMPSTTHHDIYPDYELSPRFKQTLIYETDN